MGHGWGQNIALEMLHVWVGYVLRAQVAQTSKCASNCLLRLDMFRWVVGFEVLVLRLMFRGMRLLIVKMNVGPSLKHDMFLCWFALWPTLGHFKVSDAFTTCHWNNVKGILSPTALISNQRSKVQSFIQILLFFHRQKWMKALIKFQGSNFFKDKWPFSYEITSSWRRGLNGSPNQVL
jgi:hypothetical protein